MNVNSSGPDWWSPVEVNQIGVVGVRLEGTNG